MGVVLATLLMQRRASTMFRLSYSKEGWHYVKAKFIALKDLWYEAQGKIENKEKYEAHHCRALLKWYGMI